MSDALEDIPTEGEDGEEKPDDETVFVPSSANLCFQTKKFVLQALLDKAAAVLPSKDIVPVLKNFQIEATPGKIRIIATDLELSVIATAEMVSVKTQGVAVFPGKRLIEIAKEAEDGELTLDVVEGEAHIAVGRATWDLKLMDGSEYPPLPDIDEVEFHNIDRGKFLGAIAAVRYAAASETVRANLMMINVKDGVMQAADGIRFQQADIGAHFPLNIQIPIGAVDDLVRLLRATDQNTLDIGETDSCLVFKIASDVFISQKVTALFPNVEEILLKPALANDQKLYLDRQDLLSAIRRVRITADDETSCVVLSLGKGLVTIWSRDKLGSQAAETLEAKWDNPERDVAMNHKHLTQMLEMSDAKSCQFLLGNDTKTRPSPLMLKDEESGNIGICNQMRIDFATN